MTGRPGEGEYAQFYAGYVGLVPETDALEVLERQPEMLRELARGVPGERETFRYAPGKWSIRDVFGHLTDGERVFGYRAFCISRGDRTPLPSFEENDYVASAQFGETSLAQLVEEFATVRESNLAFLRRLDPPRWQNVGTANNAAVSVRALGYIMGGHVRHHVNVLHNRYSV